MNPMNTLSSYSGDSGDLFPSPNQPQKQSLFGQEQFTHPIDYRSLGYAPPIQGGSVFGSGGSSGPLQGKAGTLLAALL